MIRAAAVAMSAERPRITGLLPPSSRVSGVRLSAAAFITWRAIDGRAGEDQVVERQARERLADLRPAGDHRDLFLGEGAAEHARHQRRGGRRVLRRLDHRPVAGRQDAGQRREGEVDREVPRADHAHHALGLEAHLGLGAEEAEQRRRRLAPLRLHPLLQVGLGVLQRADRAGDVGEGGGLGRARRRSPRSAPPRSALRFSTSRPMQRSSRSIRTSALGAPSRRCAAFCRASRACIEAASCFVRHRMIPS